MTDDDLDVLAAMARMVPDGAKPIGMICLNEGGGICLLYHAVVTSDVMASILKAAQENVRKTETLQ